MKKYPILLLILSMCGGTAESDFEPFAEEMLVAKDVMSEVQEENQKEYKKSEITDEETTTTVLEKSIFWGATDVKPEVYAAEDVSQATIDLTVEWVNKAISYWGNYGPLEIWIVGSGKEETIALDDKWCEVRTEKDQLGMNSGTVLMEIPMKVEMVGHPFIDI